MLAVSSRIVISSRMDEPRAYVIPLAIWTIIAGVLIASWTDLHLYTKLACVLWFVLAMIALLAQTSPGGRERLVGTLRTSHYTQVYRYVARPLSDWVWRRVGMLSERDDGTAGPPPETTPVLHLFRAALTWRLLDRAMLIAVAYPLLAFLLTWLLLGNAAVLGAGVVALNDGELREGGEALRVVDFWPERAAMLGLFVILTAGFLGKKMLSASPRIFWQSVSSWLTPVTFALAFALVMALLYRYHRLGADFIATAFVVGLAVPFTVAVAVEFAGAFAGAVAVAFAGTVAVAVALANNNSLYIDGLGLLSGALVVAFAGTVAFAYAVGWLWLRGWQAIVLVVLGASWALGLIAVVLFVDLTQPMQDRGVLVLVAVLPLINGPFDALSYAITLALSRKGLGTRWAPLWGLADLALGAVLFLALGATMVVVIAALNTIGTVPIYDLASLFAGLRASPGDYWWLYLILFSTLAPTALHLLVAVLAVQGLVLFQNPRRMVAGWIADAPDSHGAAVGAFLAQATIWWLPLIALAVLGWALWQLGGGATAMAGQFYLNQLEALARWINAI